MEIARSVEKPHNSGQWSKARFHSFIAGALRQASNRWPPKYLARKASKVAYGKYTCAGYSREAHIIRAKDVRVDHINPVVDPATGFVTWDEFITRLFCEAENFQVLCKSCHDNKSRDEKVVRSNGKAGRT